VAGDWEVLRRGWNGDEAARPSRSVGKLRGVAVHRLGDGSRNRQQNVMRRRTTAGSRTRAAWRSRGGGGVPMAAERIRAG
jgi:hypothetical protein